MFVDAWGALEADLWPSSTVTEGGPSQPAAGQVGSGPLGHGDFPGGRPLVGRASSKGLRVPFHSLDNVL